jgi:hypothetical protein
MRILLLLTSPPLSTTQQYVLVRGDDRVVLLLQISTNLGTEILGLSFKMKVLSFYVTLCTCRVVGMITRKDLMGFNIDEKLRSQQPVV